MKTKILPCPICGATIESVLGNGQPILYYGTLSAMSSGVRCCECKLQVDEPSPDDWPKETPKKLIGKPLLKVLISVKKGAAMLDAKLPTWPHLIDTQCLNMDDMDVCIAGQLQHRLRHQSMTCFLDDFCGLRGYWDEHGFCNEYQSAEWSAMHKEAWTAQIERRIQHVEQIKAEVARGAALLDEKVPGWFMSDEDSYEFCESWTPYYDIYKDEWTKAIDERRLACPSHS